MLCERVELMGTSALEGVGANEAVRIMEEFTEKGDAAALAQNATPAELIEDCLSVSVSVPGHAILAAQVARQVYEQGVKEGTIPADQQIELLRQIEAAENAACLALNTAEDLVL
jgi:hypothetical protein